MALFKDTEEFYDILYNFFLVLMDEPSIGPKILAKGLIIRFDYTEPDANLTLDSTTNQVIKGDNDLKADVIMSMKSDVAHRFWLGKVNLVVALTKGDIKAKGPIAKIMALLPIIMHSYGMYKEYLKKRGREDLIA
jgi:putative sterol carrier protein